MVTVVEEHDLHEKEVMFEGKCFFSVFLTLVAMAWGLWLNMTAPVMSVSGELLM